MYDYLIVGAGLFGSVFAREAALAGCTCLVIDRRSHIGGNVYCEEVEGIQVHTYGAHIFHTSMKSIWDYVNQFADFNRFTNAPIANFRGEIYNLPFNMNTFNKLWGVITPEEAKLKIEAQKAQAAKENSISADHEPANCEEQAISLVGPDIYEKLIHGYTKKQWGREPKDLPAFIIKRLPVRFTYDNNYFNDKYQGIPEGGYNVIVERLLDHSNIEVRLESDFFLKRTEYEAMAEKIVFTGRLDEYFGECYGPLAYRSLRFEHEVLDTDNYQGNAVVNYTDATPEYTRIIEHKHFAFGTQEKTVITKEYSSEWTPGVEPYYPVNDETNNVLADRYRALAALKEGVIFGGRLADYKYYDMHQVIYHALETVKNEMEKRAPKA